MAFENKEKLLEAIINYAPGDFVSYFIFEPIPYIFNENLGTWISWKTQLGKAIDVDPKDIVLTGSGALGFSLNPSKYYKPFDEGSDIDCGVISPHHFDVAWRYLRQKRPEWLTLDRTTRNAIKDHKKNYVFEGTIATDRMLGILPFGKTWQAALKTMSETEPTKNRDVKLRIYKDYDSLRHYQAKNLEKLRTDMAKDNDELDIEVEE